MNKIILHIDFNSFFASVEQQANPFLRGKPIAVAGKSKRDIDALDITPGQQILLRQSKMDRTVITTASMEAKAMGVKTAMSTIEAKKLCPELIVIPGDGRKYSEITKRFLAILHTYTPNIEQFSLDEAFADITHIAEDYFGATMIAQMIRNDVKEQCGEFCTASIGIAPNKIMAKLACESKKPNGLTVVSPSDLEDFVLTRPLAAFCGIGHRIEARLRDMGVTSVETLRAISLENLEKEFKQYGRFLYNYARGIGDDRVISKKEDPKSIGHSYTFPFDLYKASEMKRGLFALCDKVAIRMRKQGFIATHVSGYIRYKGGGNTGGGQQFSEPMVDGHDLYKNAWNIIEKTRDRNRAVRLIGISARGLVKTKMPKSIFKKPEKIYKTLIAFDTLEERFGKGIWKRAATVGASMRERTSGWHYDHET